MLVISMESLRGEYSNIHNARDWKRSVTLLPDSPGEEYKETLAGKERKLQAK